MMRSTKYHLVLLAIVVTACNALSLSATELDVIVLKGGDGQRLEGKIEQDTPEQLTIRDTMNQQHPVNGSDVELVLMYSRSRIWNNSLDRMDEGRYDVALTNLLRMHEDLDKGLGREEAKKYAYLYTAICAQKSANAKNAQKNLAIAAEYYEKYLQFMPNGRNVKQAVQGAVDCYMAVGKTDKVVPLIQVLETIDPQGSAILKGQIAIINKRWDEAITAVQRVSQGKGPVAIDAKMVMAQALVGKNELNGAKEMADEVIGDDNTQDSHKAKAYLILGNIHYENAQNAAADPEKVLKFKDALLEYIRVAYLFTNEPKLPAEALSRAITVCDALGNFRGESVYRRHKEVLKKTLQKQYPSSPEAAKLK